MAEFIERSSNLIIARYAPEIMLKARKTRERFIGQLAKNLKSALEIEGVACSIDRQQGRFMLETRQVEATLELLPRIFGVASFSPVELVVEGTQEDIVNAAGEVFAERVQGRTYAVRIKSLGGKVLSSRELECEVGAALDGPGKVDLSNPEVTVRAELRGRRAYFYSRHFTGALGFPVGIQGRGVCLISGGLDSPVAAWRMLRRGMALDYVFCNLGGQVYERQAIQVVKALTDRWETGLRPRLNVIDFGPVIDDLKAKAKPTLWQIVLKRLMYRAAGQIAGWTKADALITGEALGQVSSQTPSNLRSIESASDLPVLRPLIGFEKTDIVHDARRIGTAALSEKIKEYCAIAPKHPAVRSTQAMLDAEEAKLDPLVLSAAIQERQVLDLAVLEPKDLQEAGLLVEEAPDGARVIDCRSDAHYRQWRFPGAEHHTAEDLAREFHVRLSKDDVYMLYCEQGVRSAFIAGIMREAGYKAYAFGGSLSRLKKMAMAEDIRVGASTSSIK